MYYRTISVLLHQVPFLTSLQQANAMVLIPSRDVSRALVRAYLLAGGNAAFDNMVNMYKLGARFRSRYIYRSKSYAIT
jgi:hypothetical protein